MMYSRIVTVAGLMLMAACAPKPDMPGLDGSYRLAGIDGQKVPASATLTIAGNQISGQGPCNAYNAQNSAAWPAVALSPIASTRRACITEGGESGYFMALGQTNMAQRSGDMLVLSGPQYTMRFIAE